MLSSAAPVLAGIGVSAVVAGAALAAIRQRAKTKSRMGTLNTLLQQLVNIEPRPVPDVVPEPGEESVVTITLSDDEAPATESWLRNLPLVLEKTEIEITGLTGDEGLEQTGGTARFKLDSVSGDIPPKVSEPDQIPNVIKDIEDMLPDFDLGADNVTVKVVDNRTIEEIPEDPPATETPPVPFEPAQIAKGNNAVIVFDPDSAKVFRILKKNTFQRYAADAKKSKDKDAAEFADRYSRYDSILKKIRADGVFVNSDELESELSKISSGVDGDSYRVSYTRTRKGKKRKSSTGGFTDAGKVKSVGDIRKNIKGAPGARPLRNAGEMTVIYLIGTNTIAALRGTGLGEDQAKVLANKALAAWADAGNRPKIADLGVKDEKVAGVLRGASLAEAMGLLKQHRYAVVEVTPSFLKRILREVVREEPTKSRWETLAGLS